MTTLLDVARWLELHNAKAMAARLGLSYPVSVRELIRRALEGAPKIEHVFVLVLENRSFDHLLGFAGITGTDIAGQPTKALDLMMVPTLLDVARLWDPPIKSVQGMSRKLGVESPPIRVSALINGLHSNEDSNKHTIFASASAPNADSQGDPDFPKHEFADVLQQLGNGKYPQKIVNNAGFVTASNASVMRCVAPQNVPVLLKLASEFALCDRWFSSVPGPTWPNRFFLHAASSGGLVDSPDPLEELEAVTVDGYDFNNGTIFDRLDDHDLPWRIFAGDRFPVSAGLAGLGWFNIDDFDDFSASVNDPEFDAAYTFIEPNYSVVKAENTYRNGNSQHPPGNITAGENLIKTVYETLRNSPLWYKCVLLITYDEGGGFFDHLPPPVAVPPGDGISDAVSDDDDNPTFDFAQLGVRVPAVVVSPHIRRGIIDHTLYDHTSLLATLERLFGLQPLTDRDRLAHSFEPLFSLTLPRRDTPTVLPPAAASWFLGAKLATSGPEPMVSSLMASNEEANENDPIPVDQYGFLRIALRELYSRTPARKRAEVIREFQGMRTLGDARKYIERVCIQCEDLPLPAIFVSGTSALVLPLPLERVLGPCQGLTAEVSQQREVPFYCYSTFGDSQCNGLNLRFSVSPDPGIAKVTFPNLCLGQGPARNSVLGLRPGLGVMRVTARSTAANAAMPKFASYSFPILVT